MHHGHGIIVSEGELHPGSGLHLEFILIEFHLWGYADGETSIDLKIGTFIERFTLNLFDLWAKFFRHIGDGLGTEVL